MRNTTEADRARLRESLVGNLLLLLFGCGVLAFLVAVDRAEWFSIRPATGTSIAMARSTEKPAHSFQEKRATFAQNPGPETPLNQ